MMPRKPMTDQPTSLRPSDPMGGELGAWGRRDAAEVKAILQEVKPAYRGRFLDIVTLTDAYCLNHLQPLHMEYACLSHSMAALLCQKGSPVVEGRSGPEGWAAAIVGALGFVNFLSDPDKMPVKTMAEVAAGFGVSESGMGAKCSKIRKLLDLEQFDPGWTLPSMLGDNPYVWMLETTSGMIVDVRRCSRDAQVAASEAGLIPYVPADAAGEAGEAEAGLRIDGG